MKKFTVGDGGNPDGTAKDRDGATPGTKYKAEYYNDNIFNLFKFVEAQGYTLIDDDISQLAKASKALYSPDFTYNTSAIATQSVNDVVRGSDGKYHEALADGINGDDPVGSITGNWKLVTLDKNVLGLNNTVAFTPTLDYHPATKKFVLDNAGGFVIRAWVVFNGIGTVSIIGSGNVSSISDNGTGLYGVNLLTPISDDLYNVTTGGNRADSGDLGQIVYYNRTTTQFKLKTGNTAGTATDYDEVSATIVR